MRVGQVTLLHEYLERSAQRTPDKRALICGDRALTWSEIDEQSTRLAQGLHRLGVARGDRILIYLDNSIESCLSIFGILKAGAIFSPVNPQTKSDKLSYLLNDCRAKLLIADALLARIYAPALAQAPHLRHALIVHDAGQRPALAPIGGAELHSFSDLLATTDPVAPPCPTIPYDLAAIIYTSGTTGEPKGVMLTHHNMVAAAESITTYLGNVADDVVINVLPLSFDYGLYQWLMVAQFSGTLVLERSFNYPAQVLQSITRHGVTGLPVVPTLVSLLRPLIEGGLTLPGVRYVTNTAAALSPTHIELLARLCPQARIFAMYGLTECKRVAYLPPAELDRRRGSVGHAMPNMEVMIVDDAGHRLPPESIGELVVRGPQVMRGYWEKPEATAERLKPGDIPGEMHLYTGDYFRMDSDGFLYFVGRRDDMIKSRGEKVSPQEVENTLYSLPGVQEAAAIGVPDEVFGQAIHAYLVLASGSNYTPQQVVRYCAQRVEPFMVPKYVTFLSALPKTASNKISKKNLIEWARKTRLAGDE